MPEPTLTERKDLKSGRSGWEGAVKGTERRIKDKLGPMVMGPDTHMLSHIPWGGSVERRK